MSRLDKHAKKMQEFLEEAGLAASTRTKVRRAFAEFGIIDPRSILVYSPKELSSEISGLTSEAAQQVCDLAQSQYGSENIFLSLDDLQVHEAKTKFVSTDSKKLDNILQGGFPTQSFIELYGLPQMGKTQLCLSVAVNTIKSDRGVIWIDTEGAFRSERILALAELRGVSPEKMKKHLFVVTAKNLRRLRIAINQSGMLFADHDIGLVVIDSLMNPFRSEYSGLGDLGERQRELNKFLNHLKRLTSTFNSIVLYTNHVMAKIDPYAPGPSIVPIGGHVLGHASDIRIWMRLATKAEKGGTKSLARTATIVDCGWLPQASATFAIGSFAIADIEEAEKFIKKN